MNNNQRDPRWANIPVGSGEQTIGQIGCTVTVIGDILGLTPDVVNAKMTSVDGFADQNLIIWDKIAIAFPGTKVHRVWQYTDSDVLANVPNVIVEAPATPIGGRGSHWTRYIGNHQLVDPWTGRVRPTSDFPNQTGYCVIIPPQPIPTPPPPLTGLSIQVGYDPTFEGQDVMVNGVHYKSIKVNNVLVWKVEATSSPTPTVTTTIPTVETSTTTTTLPTEPIIPQTPPIQPNLASKKSFFQSLWDYLKKYLRS